jgi:crotonobetainyl-CoA:carnitine CoA-transferase CaiB-like acyl-CoA transferase
MLLDLKTAEGKEIFWRLVEDADVIVQNYRAGKLAKLGLGYEDIRKRRPDIIYASTNAYGHVGPWAERPGHESFIQTVTGMAERFGGAGSSVGQPNAINDYGTGFMGAYGIALALLHRRRTGEGQHVGTSLAYTSMTLQSPFMHEFAGKRWHEPRGQQALGSGPLARAYRAADGWFFIGTREKDLSRLPAIEGLHGIESLSADALVEALAARIAREVMQTWIERLLAADIGAQRVVMQIEELMCDPWVVDHGLSITREFDELGLVTACGPTPRLSRTPVVPGAAPPKPGKHAREILEEIGWGDRYEQLHAAGVIRTDGVRAG